MIYKNAEIYMTTCNHPDYRFLKYIGLDTKKDKDYMGSSVVLKWFFNLIGRSYFQKEILDTVTGTMSDCCDVEQSYIVDHNALKDPNYLNMNGKRPDSNSTREITLDHSVNAISSGSRELMSKILNDIKGSMHLKF